ncbi:unnamed protein product [Aphanomyces euteiches]
MTKATQPSYDSLAAASVSKPRSVAPPTASAGFASKLVFGWASPLLYTGSRRRLDPEDLWPLAPENQCAPLGTAFEETFARTKSLLSAFISTHGSTALMIVGLQIAMIVMSYIPPLALQQILQAIEGSDFQMDVVAQAIGFLFLAKIASAFVTVHADYLTTLVIARVAGALQHMLFQKTLLLDGARRREKGGAGDIANLFSSDMQWITTLSSRISAVWSSPIMIVVTLNMLYNVIGWAAFVGSGALVFAFVVNHGITILQRSILTKYMGEKDARMKAVAEIFSAMKIVKLQAWEERFEAKIDALRQTELKTLGHYVLAEAMQTALMFTTPVIVTLVSFFTYTIVMEETLSVSKIFTAMSLFNMLKYPMMGLPSALVSLMQAVVALQRMQDFLHLDEKRPTGDLAASTGSIVVEDATFGWDASSVLFDSVNLTIRRKELVVVHGPVSHGKSALCQALLGELTTHRGSVSLGGRVAYVPQKPWIQHMTIRDNILFGQPYDRRKYNAVVAACGLTTDLAGFPAGDRTEVGLRGMNLSGGQQARISLARACYSDADIFILDAPLAAVDAAVQREIFAQCICGLLRHKTVVLVTHNADIIHSPHVHRTICVEDGHLMDHVKARDEQPDEEPPLAAVAPVVVRPAVINETHAVVVEVGPVVKSPVALSADAVLLFHDLDESHDDDDKRILSGKLIVDEARSEGRVSAAVFWSYVVASGGWPMLLGILILLVANQLMQVAGDLWLSTWSNTAAHVTPATLLAESGAYLTIYSILVLSGCILSVARAVVGWLAGLRASRVCFESMTAALFRAPMGFFDANPVGRILNRYGNDMTSIDTRIPSAAAAFLALSAAAVSTIGTTIIAMHSMAFLILPLLYLYYRMAAFYLRSARAIERVNTVTKSPLLNLTAEAIDGADVVRAFGPAHVARLEERHHANVDRTNEAFVTAQVASLWFTLRTQLFSACTLLAIALSLVAMRLVLSPGVIGLVLNYSFGIFPVLEMVVALWSILETQMVAPERVAEYAAVVSEPPRVLPGSVTKAWPTSGKIEFDDVSFKYKEAGPLVLQRVNVSIADGEKIGLVGRSGAGKSSLTMALFRMYELPSGSIRIDGVDISTVGVQTLRSRLAIIPQSPVLFQGPLRNYLDPAGDHGDDDLWSVLRQVNMADRVALDADVEEHGANFSAGERQILCLARALLCHAKILVLDEATASTDAATDARLQQVIRTSFASSTVLIIAHRLESVMNCDRIMVFERGQVVQCDSPKTLLEKGSGAFYELSAASSGGA